MQVESLIQQFLRENQSEREHDDWLWFLYSIRNKQTQHFTLHAKIISMNCPRYMSDYLFCSSHFNWNMTHERYVEILSHFLTYNHNYSTFDLEYDYLPFQCDDEGEEDGTRTPCIFTSPPTILIHSFVLYYYGDQFSSFEYTNDYFFTSRVDKIEISLFVDNTSSQSSYDVTNQNIVVEDEIIDNERNRLTLTNLPNESFNLIVNASNCAGSDTKTFYFKHLKHELLFYGVENSSAFAEPITSREECDVFWWASVTTDEVAINPIPDVTNIENEFYDPTNTSNNNLSFPLPGPVDTVWTSNNLKFDYTWRLYDNQCNLSDEIHISDVIGYNQEFQGIHSDPSVIAYGKYQYNENNEGLKQVTRWFDLAAEFNKPSNGLFYFFELETLAYYKNVPINASIVTHYQYRVTPALNFNATVPGSGDTVEDCYEVESAILPKSFFVRQEIGTEPNILFTDNDFRFQYKVYKDDIQIFQSSFLTGSTIFEISLSEYGIYKFESVMYRRDGVYLCIPKTIATRTKYICIIPPVEQPIDYNVNGGMLFGTISDNGFDVLSNGEGVPLNQGYDTLGNRRGSSLSLTYFNGFDFEGTSTDIALEESYCLTFNPQMSPVNNLGYVYFYMIYFGDSFSNFHINILHEEEASSLELCTTLGWVNLNQTSVNGYTRYNDIFTSLTDVVLMPDAFNYLEFRIPNDKKFIILGGETSMKPGTKFTIKSFLDYIPLNPSAEPVNFGGTRYEQSTLSALKIDNTYYQGTQNVAVDISDPSFETINQNLLPRIIGGSADFVSRMSSVLSNWDQNNSTFWQFETWLWGTYTLNDVDYSPNADYFILSNKTLGVVFLESL